MRSGKERHKILVFFDLEMYCAKERVSFPEMESICLGAVKYNINTNEKTFFHAFIKPIKNKKLTEYCKELTGIKQKNIDEAKSFKEVFFDFKDWIGNIEETQLLSWGGNDIQRLEIDCQLAEIDKKDFQLFKNNYTNFQKEFTKKVTGQDKSVENSLKLYEANFEGKKHNPMYDALNTLKIYLHYKKDLYKTEAIKLEEMIFKEQQENLKMQFKKNYDFLFKYNDYKVYGKKIDGIKNPSKNFEDVKFEIIKNIKEALKYDLLSYKKHYEGKSLIKQLEKMMKRANRIRKTYTTITEIESLILDKIDIKEAIDDINKYYIKISNMYKKGNYYELQKMNLKEELIEPIVRIISLLEEKGGKINELKQAEGNETKCS